MRHLPVLLASLGVCACGGGGKKPSTPPETGHLAAGGAAGIHFATPTQSGTTDAGGTFRYLPGEIVTFSIGGVQLGAVPGAASISLFTLAGASPPTTELALRRELERAQRQATPLVRVMNLARLLIALDADGDPGNGVEVGSRAADLANKQIDPGLTLVAFETRLNRLTPDITRNIPASRTLSFAYQAANLTVATHNPVSNEDLSVVFGRPSSTITYLPNGARAAETSILGGLGLSTAIVTYSYDALGRLTGLSSRSSLGEGEPSSGSASTTSYDARGNKVGAVNEQQLFGQTIYRGVSTATPDAYGAFTEQTFDADGDGDGDVDSRQITTTTFDARGNPTSSTTTIDSDADGDIDQRYTFADTFDATGRLRMEVFESDDDADGVIDLRAVTTVVDDGPRALIRTVSQDAGADGSIDDRSITRYVFDDAGNNISVTVTDSRGPDDTVYGYAVFTMTYDADRRLLSRSRVQSIEVGGVPYSTDSIVNTFDSRGQLVRVVTDSSSSFGGVPGPVRQTVSYEYGDNGERTMTRMAYDDGADGVVEIESATRTTHQVFTEGVLPLAQQYFELGYGALDYVSAVAGALSL